MPALQLARFLAFDQTDSKCTLMRPPAEANRNVANDRRAISDRTAGSGHRDTRCILLAMLLPGGQTTDWNNRNRATFSQSDRRAVAAVSGNHPRPGRLEYADGVSAELDVRTWDHDLCKSPR